MKQSMQARRRSKRFHLSEVSSTDNKTQPMPLMRTECPFSDANIKEGLEDSLFGHVHGHVGKMAPVQVCGHSWGNILGVICFV